MNTESPGYGASSRYVGVAGESYYERQTGAYARVKGLIESKKFQRFISDTDEVLDFGCGGGFVLSSIACRHRLGVEVNPVARAAAQSQGITCFDRLEAVPDDCADVIISNHALEHVPYPIEVLRQLKTKARKGGKIILYLPMDDWRTQRRYNARDQNHHLHTWTPQLIGNSIIEADLDPKNSAIEVVTNAFPPRVCAQLWLAAPEPVFNLACWLTAIILKRRQLFVQIRVS